MALGLSPQDRGKAEATGDDWDTVDADFFARMIFLLISRFRL